MNGSDAIAVPDRQRKAAIGGLVTKESTQKDALYAVDRRIVPSEPTAAPCRYFGALFISRQHFDRRFAFVQAKQRLHFDCVLTESHLIYAGSRGQADVVELLLLVLEFDDRFRRAEWAGDGRRHDLRRGSARLGAAALMIRARPSVVACVAW